MSINKLIAQWNVDPSIGPNFSAVKVFPNRNPTFCDIPSNIDLRLISFLDTVGIQQLYQHQGHAYTEINSGKNVVLVTGTSSGKSLAYILPILDRILKNPAVRGLFLYPTKALAHDQLSFLNQLPAVNVQAYDGDTPHHLRKSIRNEAQIIISNPDMLHLGILPYHIEWMDFFSNLEFIVIDEIHSYRGVFGSHVANVIHRLNRITQHYNSPTQFILTSATIGNPHNFAQQLINDDVTVIDDDASSRGKKTFIIYNPPVIDKKLGTRASLQQECIRLTSDLIHANLQTILFARTRRNVEFLLTKLHDRFPDKNDSIKSYRSGYLSIQRRKIENGLKDGSIRCVTATNALELGIDIGGLDAAILAGYPGTIAGTLQQAGRSGRTSSDSLSILVASSSPLDQYLAANPDFLFETNPENALINPENLLITLAHIQCALYELPFENGMTYGTFSANQTVELLDVIKNQGNAYYQSPIYYWMADDYPASNISLRTASPNQVILQVDKPSEKPINIGLVDKNSAYWMVHPGAIYLHEGETYIVNNLDLDQDIAYLSPASQDYYTESESKTSFNLINQISSEKIPGGFKYFGDLEVISQVIGYKKIKWGHYNVFDKVELDLPTTSLITQGYWITISQESEDILKADGTWTSSPNDYGPNWDDIRQKILMRDDYICQLCGRKNSETPLHIHHKIPMRNFTNRQEANSQDNLISLCPRCHKKAESVVKINSGIRGVGYALHALAPVLLMCDPGDLGQFTDFKSPIGDPRPISLLYEYVPAGIGFSKTLYDQHNSLVNSAYQLVSHCLCLNGCPSCVGPGGEKGSGGKSETMNILNLLVQ
jgi:DEAD/DEAH box helicase domain-containing protein